jgi:hypothetical protein
MDQNQQDLVLDENIKQVIRTLPAPIRTYIGQGGYSLVAKGLMKKYGLRIDQGTVLEREIMLLLMGIENPSEFTAALATEGRLDQQAINGITHDVNEQIFIPLSQQMRSSTVQQPTRPAPRASVPVPSYISQSSVIPANPSMPMRPQQQQSGYVTNGPKYVQPRPTPVAPAPVQRPSAQPMAAPLNSARMLSDHEEPSPSLGQIVRTMTQPPVGFRTPQRSYMPPANLPGMMSGATEPNIVRRPPVSDTPPPPVPLTPKPPPQPYAADPYHEPIDEPGA